MLRIIYKKCDRPLYKRLTHLDKNFCYSLPWLFAKNLLQWTVLFATGRPVRMIIGWFAKTSFSGPSFLLVEGSVPPAIFWHTRTFDLAFPSLMCPTNKTCLVVNINVKQCPKENVPTDSKVQNTITAVSAADSDCEIKWLSAIMGGWGREPAWRASYTRCFF